MMIAVRLLLAGAVILVGAVFFWRSGRLIPVFV